MLVPSAIRDYKINRLLGRRDSRTVARQWIEQNIPRGSTIAITSPGAMYGKPQLTGYRFEPLSEPGRPPPGGMRWVLSDSDLLPFYASGPSATELRQLETNGELVFEVDPRKPNTPEPIYDENDAFWVPLRHGSSVKRPGPRIRIWKVEDPRDAKQNRLPQ